MNQVPANRYVIFILLAFAGFAADVISKNVVFSDLGYVLEAGSSERQKFVVGENQRFERDLTHLQQGVSKPYMEGWLAFRFHTSFNHGALWGFGQGFTWVFAAMSFLAIVAVIAWLFVWKAARSSWLTTSLGFIMAGTLGNLWDRMAWHGYSDKLEEPVHAVRDFLYFRFGKFDWPVFNFADVFLVTGAIMLIVQAVYLDAKYAKKAEDDSKKEAATEKTLT